MTFSSPEGRREVIPNIEGTKDKRVYNFSIEGSVKERSKIEGETLNERREKLNAKIETLFTSEELGIEVERVDVLKDDIRDSLQVPQWGGYHNEGMYMDTHLERILGAIDVLSTGEVPEGVDESLAQDIKQIANRAFKTDSSSDQRDAVKKSFEQYVFLHDIEKKDCLTLTKKTGEEPKLDKKGNPRKNKEGEVIMVDIKEKVAVTWEEWQDLLPEDLKNGTNPEALSIFMEEQGIVGISYYQEQEEGNKKHGAEGADTVEDFGMEGTLLATAIRNHEVAFQFTTFQPDTYQKYFGDLSEEEIDWVMIASLVDNLGSLREPNKEGKSIPDLSNFKALLDTRHNVLITKQLYDVVDNDDDIAAWVTEGKLKPTRVEQTIRKIEVSKKRLTSVENLLKEVKSTLAPKLLEGKVIGQLVGVLKKQGLGRVIGALRGELSSLAANASIEDVRTVVEKHVDDKEKAENLINWVSSNI